jgi:hypothetical protein
MTKTTMAAAAAALGLLLAGAAGAATMNFHANLAGTDEVPSNMTSGTGEVKASLDTKTKIFSYTITYSGLTGPATMAHFHGPAAAGANAPPVIAIHDLKGPISGTASLSDAQEAELKAGLWYFNVHTAAHPGGEIRGQVLAAP